MVRKKIIIINWKWTWFHENRVTDSYLSKPENQYLLSDIKKGKNKFFEVYPVENSNQTEDAIVVVTSIYQGKQTKEILYKLIEHICKKYKAEPDEIYLFLHRGNFYNGQDVLLILEEIDCITNCFLFAAGRDFIYFDLKKEGFLDQAGGFKRGRIGDQKISVVKKTTELFKNSNTRWKIQQPYFDNVWNYYQFEFYTKISKLKRDFFAWLILYKIKEYPLKQADFIEDLKKAEKLLYIRLKSFLGEYDDLQNSIPLDEDEFEALYRLKDEREALEKFEKESNDSYILDDCNANLIHIHKNDELDKKAHDYYIELKEKLNQVILTKNTETKITHTDIIKIRNCFKKLTKVLPGSPNQ